MGSPSSNDDPEKLAPTATNGETLPRAGSVGSIDAPIDRDEATYGKTKRGLKSRHAQMIALGGSIGTG